MSTASGPKLKYIKPDTVAELIRAGETRRPEFLVIDVRSSDFPGGNLPGAVNITTREFRDDAAIDRVIQRHIAPRLPQLRTVVVHCMRSQTRGPYAAHLLSRSPSLPPDVEVVVLEGGFQGWLRRYKGEKVLFEGLDGAAQGWEDVVQAEEGSTLEAEDSRRLREGRA
ncbi:Cdc25 phosphatase Ibp1 [Rhodotorula kratochvilovae]